MENYKLFDKRTIVFADALSVFDGPNGYGKTSTFDAIELLITGDISRVLENDAISAKLSYAESFLAKDQSRDVVIRGEFRDSITGERMVIARCIPYIQKKSEAKKKDLNPKSLRGMVKTYFLSDFDLPRDQWEPAREGEAREKCDRFFGPQNVSLYTLLHYVRQEDRLSFFKKKEEERTDVIEGLFGLKEYRDKLKRAESAHLKWTREYNLREKEIGKLQDEAERRPKDAVESMEYESLAHGVPAWDREDLGFRGGDTSDLQQMLLETVDGVEALIRQREEFAVDEDTRAFRGLQEKKKPLAILAWKLQCEDPNAVEVLRQRKDKQKFCQSQNEYLRKAQYTSVDWKRLCEVLDIPELAAEFTALTGQIAKSRENQSELKKSLIELNDARDLLRQQAQKAKMLEDGTCPYCGHSWGEIGHLEERFEKTRAHIQTILGREAEDCVLLAEQIKNMFQQLCGEKWERLLRELDRDVALQIFCRYGKWQDFRNEAAACEPVMKRLGIAPEQIPLGGTPDEAILGTSELLRRMEALWTSLSAEYVALDQRYGFGKLCRESFSSPDALERISPEMLAKKRQYIRYQYYRSFDQSRETLRRLEEEQKLLGDLRGQLEQYIKSLNNAINAYRKRLISQIEIPFFLYSSRLLQSYHGGQGVLISTKEGDKVRFTAPGREHDVLYTMSSGQLSAVLLAFALSLNQIYAGSGFRTMLIDDPIQCMDDINMVSLVELLGREFGDSQVILSTHEDTFAKYIQYKYERYGLTHKAVSLKDDGPILQNA